MQKLRKNSSFPTKFEYAVSTPIRKQNGNTSVLHHAVAEIW